MQSSFDSYFFLPFKMGRKFLIQIVQKQVLNEIQPRDFLCQPLCYLVAGLMLPHLHLNSACLQTKYSWYLHLLLVRHYNTFLLFQSKIALFICFCLFLYGGSSPTHIESFADHILIHLRFSFNPQTNP